jgi:hypothetical protein
MLNYAKIFVAEMENMLSSMNEEKINLFRNKIKKLLR